ncbi:hypothetical protein KXZ60_27025 [Klebsiella pneumoniae]|nr:hypothetical protein [Salmonella enterica]MBY8452598.1 hypothetical protein [Klebsiella pneumoniae]
MKTQPTTGETYPKSDLFNKASLDVPSRGEMTLSHQWQNADGEALREVKTEKCGAFHSFKGKAPNVKSVLEKQRSGEL